MSCIMSERALRVCSLVLIFAFAMVRSAQASPVNLPDPFATFAAFEPALPPPSGPGEGSHIVEFSINAAKPIKTLHARFYTEFALSTFGPAGSFLINPADASPGSLLTSTAAQEWTIDLEFITAKSGVFDVVRLDQVSLDGINWGYGATATGNYADGTSFSMGYSELAIPEPTTASLGLVVALGLMRLARGRGRRCG